MTQTSPDVVPEPTPDERPPAGAPPPLAVPSPWGARAAALRARVLPWIERLPRAAVVFLRVVVALAAAGAIGAYLVLGIIHLRYPFELEWMEGGMLDEVRRALAGQKLYVKPTVEYVPFLYAPLYFYVAAAFSKVLGLGFFSARLVSYLASVAAIALVARFVHRETGGKLAALLAAGVFAATYHLASGFHDIARVDSLFVLLLLAALHVVRFRRSVKSAVAAAFLFTLALLTKQSASVIFLPVAAYLVLAERRRGLVFAASGAAMMVGSVFVLDRIHDGWFWYFVFWLPRQHPWVSRMWVDFWIDDLMRPLSVSCLFALFYVLIDRRVISSSDARQAEPGDAHRGAAPVDAQASDPDAAVPTRPAQAVTFAITLQDGRYFYLFVAAGMLGASWAGRLHMGGWPNVIMPGFAILAIHFGLGIQAALDAAAGLVASRRHRIEVFLFAVAALQFACLAYDPSRYVPKSRDAAAGQHLLDKIRAVDGEVFIPAHGHLATLAGKRPYAHQMAIADIVGIGGGPAGADLLADIQKAISDKRFSAIFSDMDFFKKEIDLTYRQNGKVFADKKVFWPVTGLRVRPERMYVPKDK
ncbi:glycosyltransferase family 39 protein [Sorangium sp. So ce1014]|uniref:ArnT family glycosyltransferase n=1 Tax=Sorangium sp. So ce1014 TaxID=3133326 RepID=UPI003F604D6D